MPLGPDPLHSNLARGTGFHNTALNMTVAPSLTPFYLTFARCEWSILLRRMKSF